MESVLATVFIDDIDSRLRLLQLAPLQSALVLIFIVIKQSASSEVTPSEYK